MIIAFVSKSVLLVAKRNWKCCKKRRRIGHQVWVVFNFIHTYFDHANMRLLCRLCVYVDTHYVIREMHTHVHIFSQSVWSSFRFDSYVMQSINSSILTFHVSHAWAIIHPFYSDLLNIKVHKNTYISSSIHLHYDHVVKHPITATVLEGITF